MIYTPHFACLKFKSNFKLWNQYIHVLFPWSSEKNKKGTSFYSLDIVLRLIYGIKMIRKIFKALMYSPQVNPKQKSRPIGTPGFKEKGPLGHVSGVHGSDGFLGHGARKRK